MLAFLQAAVIVLAVAAGVVVVVVLTAALDAMDRRNLERRP